MKPVILLALILIASTFSVATAGITNRIIGGGNATHDQFPFAAYLLSTTRIGKFNCVGSLISDQWILTAAQCVDQTTNVEIHIGSNSVKSVTDTNRIILNSVNYTKHPAYNHITLENDIAVIKLPTKVPLNSHIYPISFFQIGQLDPYANVVTIGWGVTNDTNRALPDNLVYVNITTIPLNVCQEYYGDQVKATMICTNGALDKGTCEGDMGAPLVAYLRNTYNYIVGVASFLSSRGCEQRQPSGFTKVANYTTWISNVTGITAPPLY